MGSAKRQLEAQEEARGAAMSAAIQAKVIKVCDSHEECYFLVGDPDDKLVYAIATNSLKGAPYTEDERKMLMDAVKEVIADAGDECARCAYLLNKDD